MQGADGTARAALAARTLRQAIQRAPWRYYIGFALGRGSALIVLPVAARVLGASGLGQLEVALAIMMAATIVLDAGLGAALIRYWHDARFQQHDVLASAIRLQIVAAALASLLFAPVALTLGFERNDAFLLAVVIVAFAFVEGFAVIGGAMLRAEARDRTYLAMSGVRFLVAIVLGSIGVLTLGMPGALLGVALGGIGFAVLAAREFVHTWAFGTGAARRQLARYGVPLITTTAATWCLGLSDRLFLQAFVSSSEIGHYSANYRLGSIVIAFVAAPMALAWLPVAQRAAGADRHVLMRRWGFGFTFVSLTVSALLVAISSLVVPAIFGADFHADAVVVGLVGLAGWMAGMYYVVATPLFVGDSTRVLAICAGITIGLNLALTPLAIAALGVRGAALATALSYGGLCLTAWIAARRVSAVQGL